MDIQLVSAGWGGCVSPSLAAPDSPRKWIVDNFVVWPFYNDRRTPGMLQYLVAGNEIIWAIHNDPICSYMIIFVSQDCLIVEVVTGCVNNIICDNALPCSPINIAAILDFRPGISDKDTIG